MTLGIGRIPGSPAQVLFQSDPTARGLPKAITVKGPVKWSRNGVTYTAKTDINTPDPKFMGKIHHGTLKFTLVADADVGFLDEITAATVVVTNVGRVLTFTGVIPTQGDNRPDEDLGTGEVDERTFTYSSFAQELKIK